MITQVLLSAYNGESYIQEQIDSILKQEKIDLNILIRNDGSTDRTNDILSQQTLPNIMCISGENVGLVKSFIELIRCAEEADYYAFSDQDDVWDSDKLCSAIDMLKEYADIPAIYSSNAKLVDENLKLIKCENKCPITTLGSAMVKNYATGCTVVFNKELMRYLKMNLDIEVSYHDWWVNLVALCNGGISIFDDRPHINYRQHSNNVVGGAKNIFKKWSNRFKRFKKQKYNRDAIAKQLLDIYGDNIGEKNKELLYKFCDYRHKKWALILDKRVCTGKIVDDFLFYVCVFFNKI